MLDAGDARAQSVGQAHSGRDPARFRERRNYHPPKKRAGVLGRAGETDIPPPPSTNAAISAAANPPLLAISLDAVRNYP